MSLQSATPANADLKTFPRGIKIITLARMIRWIGWGLGEALLPIFLFTFSNSFAEAGLFRSIFEIATLICLPIIGIRLDGGSSKRFILMALLLYPLVGVGYFLAGLFGAAIFIVLARAINGILWGMENVGVDTYFRRMADRKILGSAFGYIETWSNFGWIVAMLFSMFLVSFVPIHYLLLAIAPGSLIAFAVALRAPKDAGDFSDSKKKESFSQSYKAALLEWISWNRHLWLLGFLAFFSALIEVLIWFFIPIDSYMNGANLKMVILLTVIANIPTLFSYKLGRLADANKKYTLVSLGLLGIAVVMGLLALFPQYAFRLFAGLALGTILQLFVVIEKALVTELGPAETYGQRGSAFESLITLGGLSAPLILGILIDSASLKFAFVGMAVVAICLCLFYASVKEVDKN